MKLNLFHCIKDKLHFRTLLNINKWLELNSDIDINREIFTDNDCINFLKEFDNKYYTESRRIFEIEPDGRFKADLWRLCILYERGGLYSDIDQEPLVPINDWLDIDNIDFCTGVSAPSNYIYQGILYAKPKSKILKACIDAHINVYLKQEQQNQKFDGNQAAIHIMCSTVRSMFKDNNIQHGSIKIGNENCLFVREIPDWNLPQNSQAFLNSFGLYTNNDTFKIMNTRYSTYFYDKNDYANFVNIE